MEHSIFHKLSRVLWGLVIGLIVMLAIYVSVGRLLTSAVVAYQDDILRELNHRLPFQVDARKVSGEWHSFTPAVVLQELRLTVPGSAAPPIELREGRVDLDVLGSLRTWSPQMRQLSLAGLYLKGEWTTDGRLLVRGFGGGDTPITEWLQDSLLNVERLALDKLKLDVIMPGGEQRQLELDMQLTREGSQRQVQASLSSTRGTQIFALAEGVGNPFEPAQFRGDLYLKLDSRDLGAVREVFARRIPDIAIAGGLSLEFWSSWEQGAPSAQLRVTGEDLLFSAADQSWQLPLDRVSFLTELVEQKGRFSLAVADLEIDQDTSRLDISRLQLDMLGETLTIRAGDIPLGPLGEILSRENFLAERAARVISTLQPQGELNSLQLSVADLSEPLRDWELLANFDQLAVQSWSGAPGVSGTHGFVQLAPGGGFVLLDSQQFSMDFPTVYEQPLFYNDFHGTIGIRWDSEAVTLSSGLVTAEGAEGVAKVLFGLNIPLVPSSVGLEMDLLVGLEDSHPTHRVKYIPYTLDDGLQSWLNQSIGDGIIDQAGFLWRGSLTSGAAELRTVQLFFNIEDTTLSYHPAWPPLSELDGILFIDDSDVSVWSERARLFDSAVNRLSVELWLDQAGAMMLAVDGQLEGPAADGLSIINGAVIGQYVGQAFADWQLSGPLQTQLALLLDLNNPDVAPEVEVTTRWQDVALDIDPGNLPIRAINGTLNYSSRNGLSSDDLSGTLWQQALTAKVFQSTADATAIQVDIDTVADMGELQQWLNLDLLEFAQGRAAADLTILVPPGATPQLTIRSALAGVSLDLPPPWNKEADTSKALTVDVLPGGESLLLGIDLDSEVKLDLDIRDSRLVAGSLGFYRQPVGLATGTFHISGELQQLKVDDWQHFVSTYLGAYLSSPVAREPVAADEVPLLAAQAQSVEAPVDLTLAADVQEVVTDIKQADSGLVVVVEQLRAGQLLIGDNEFGSAGFGGRISGDQWQLSGSSEWLRAEVHSPVAGGPLQLDISMLDLAGLEQLQFAAGDQYQSVELPDIKVSLRGLQRAGRQLGQLAFELGSQGDVLVAENITGELVGLQLLSSQPGQLRWYQGEDSHSELQASFQFVDLGKTLEQLDYQKILETKEGEFDLNLSWPGGPQDFSLLQGSGSLQVSIDRGRFLEASGGASGTLRVVSILNLAEIVRRLSLSHMFESGIPFNEMDGELLLDKGVLEVTQLDVQGGASSFHFSGESVLAEKSLDGELIVTLPVANNLSWVAALTAGLPVAAGVFVLSKVFEKQVNRLTSAVYTTSGTWDDPQVSFDRVFDDSPATAEKAHPDGAVQTEPDVVPAMPSPTPLP